MLKIEAALPEDIWDVEAIIQEIEIDETLGRALYAVWGRMLYDTRYPVIEEITPESSASFEPGYDGTYYHFSFFHRRMPLSGWIWDYAPDSKTGRFVAIVETMKAACDGESESNSTLAEQVDELAAAIEGGR